MGLEDAAGSESTLNFSTQSTLLSTQGTQKISIDWISFLRDDNEKVEASHGVLDVDEGVDGAAITVGGFSGVEIGGERSAFLLEPLGH